MKRCTECGLFAPDEASACARCEGTGFAAEGTPLLVDGRYSLEDQLGAGGMGVVYRARDVWLDRPVALKLISPKLLQQAGDLTAQFRREAATLASVRSEHVVQVYSFGPHEGSFFFAMEYVRGKDLEEIIMDHAAHGENVPIHRMLIIMQQAARGLGAVHRGGLVHLDVKPSNIVIEEDTGRPVLVDFGLARWRGQGAQTVKISGTPYYMAPERCVTHVEASSLTPQTDIYSLGCMLYEVLTGRTPFDGGSPYAVLAQHVDAPIPKVSAIKPELAEFDSIVESAMAKSPADRFESCEAFAAAIGAIVSERGRNLTRRPEAPTLPRPLPPPPPPEPPAPTPSVADANVPVGERVLRVLVVDDDPDFRRLASKAAEIALRGVRVDIRAVGSGEEAVSAAQQVPPDLMTLDFDMPGLDGTETLSELRALPQGTQARVAVVSGSAGPAERWRFAVLGVNEFIRKPVEFRDLTEALRRIARRSGWIDAKGKPITAQATATTVPNPEQNPGATPPPKAITPPSVVPAPAPPTTPATPQPAPVSRMATRPVPAETTRTRARPKRPPPPVPSQGGGALRWVVAVGVAAAIIAATWFALSARASGGATPGTGEQVAPKGTP